MNEETPNPQLMTLLGCVEKPLHEGTKNLYHGIFSILSCTTVLEFYKENITESYSVPGYSSWPE